jgi:cytochrome P450 family 130
MSLTFDPTLASFADERVAVYRRLRDETPVLRDDIRSTYVLSRFTDVFEAVSDPVTYSSVAAEAAVLLPMLNYLDAPRHGELRRLVSRAFTPARVAGLEDSIRALVDELLDRFVAAGGGDLIADVAGPLASTVVGRLIGIPVDQLARFRHLTDQLLLAGQLGGTEHLQTIAGEIYELFAALLQVRRSAPTNDLMSGLIAVQREGGLSDEELLGFCFLLVGGGNDTTTNLVANGWHLLLTHPASLEAVTRDRSILPGAIEEMLRLRPPAESHARTVTREVVLHGVVIPSGSRVQLLWGAANLDEREFEAPDAFDIYRRPSRHLTFGHGAHFCLGAALARMEARAAFDGLLDRCQTLRLLKEPQRVPSPWAFAFERLDLG